MNDQIALALHERIETVERTCRWLVDLCSALENAIRAALPPCTLGGDGPSFAPAHVELCPRCAALTELESLDDSPLPDEGGEVDEGPSD